MTIAPGSPAWSVVVPTCSRPEPLARCVAGLAALRPPAGGFEIIVVNDGGIEPPDEVRAVAVAGHAMSATFLSQPNAGPAAARNHGAERARGSWLAFTDDDCVPEPDWLRAFEGALRRAPDALIGGVVRNALRANLLAEASQSLSEYSGTFFDGTGDRERFFSTNNVAVSRAAFRGAGGFDVVFPFAAEDREFCDRWHAQGRPSVLEPRAIVHHAHDLTVTAFLRQHREYGRGGRRFRTVRRGVGRPVPINLSFYLGSLRHVARGRPALRGAVLTALTLAAHGAYLVGLVFSGARPRRRYSHSRR